MLFRSYEALETGGATPAILNAANEVAVQAFLDQRISFRRIDYVVANVLDKVMTESAVTSIDSVLMHDRAARTVATNLILQ